MRILVWVLAAATGLAAACSPQPSGRSILNVSYDATREYFEVFNREFEDAWFRETGERIVVNRGRSFFFDDCLRCARGQPK